MTSIRESAYASLRRMGYERQEAVNRSGISYTRGQLIDFTVFAVNLEDIRHD